MPAGPKGPAAPRRPHRDGVARTGFGRLHLQGRPRIFARERPKFKQADALPKTFESGGLHIYDIRSQLL